MRRSKFVRLRDDKEAGRFSGRLLEPAVRRIEPQGVDVNGTRAEGGHDVFNTARIREYESTDLKAGPIKKGE
jgi:hypothetical protein